MRSFDEESISKRNEIHIGELVELDFNFFEMQHSLHLNAFGIFSELLSIAISSPFPLLALRNFIPLIVRVLKKGDFLECLWFQTLKNLKVVPSHVLMKTMQTSS